MKERLDIYLTQLQPELSRERAKALIMAGQVYLNGQKADKAGTPVSPQDQVEIRGEQLQYVSRGGLKLEKALQNFPVSLQGAVCMDIGASTGGFTDCMLQNGAAKVYSIDVGYGQLAWKLRTDPRVVNMERTNIRYVTSQQIPEPIDFVSVDVSFISLSLVLPVVQSLLREDGCAICLVKPQFEAGRGKVGKKGVVREPEIHLEVLEKVLAFSREKGFVVEHLDYSPIKGPEGNIEYLMMLRKPGAEDTNVVPEIFPEQVVKASHQNFEQS